MKAYDGGNSENTINYLRYLLTQSPNQRLLIFWDGATYHRSKEVRAFLEEVNLGLPTEQCISSLRPLCSQLPGTKSHRRYLVTS